MKVTWDLVSFGTDGVTDTYQEDLWVPDENHPNGGSFQKVDKYYESTMICIYFEGKIKEPVLEVGCTYSVDSIPCRAVSKTQLKSLQMITPVLNFKLPDDIHMTGNPYFES